MQSIRRSQRQARRQHFIEYHTQDLCVKAENTIFSDWMTCWRNRNSIEADITVCVEDEPYLLHSYIMIFWSEYFQEHLREHKPYMVELRDMKRNSFDMVLKFMYHGSLMLDDDNLESTISIANKLEIPGILMICADYIILNLRRNCSSVVDVVEFLCLSDNQYASKIILPQLFERFDKFGSDKVLEKIPLKVLKFLIACSNRIPRMSDRNLMDICCHWIAADTDRRFCCVVELLENMTGNMNTLWKLDLGCFKPKTFTDVRNIFNGLLHCCIRGEKIDFFNYFGLAISKAHDPVVHKVADDAHLLVSCSQSHLKLPNRSEETAQQNTSRNTQRADITQFYFKQWSDRMRVLRRINTSSDITIQLHSGQEYNLDYWILCVTSKYFQNLEADSRTLVRLDLLEEEFTSVLNFMYGEVLHITPDNVCNLIRASRVLKLNSCQKLILKYLRKNIATLDMLKLFESSYCEEYDEVFEFVKPKVFRNFANFEKHSISSLRLDCFKMLVGSSSKMLKRMGIDERLDLCCDWVARDIRRRYLSGFELIEAVKYLDKAAVKSLPEEFDVRLRRKYFPTTISGRDESKLGRDFVIMIPRIDVTDVKNTTRAVQQQTTPTCRPFRIKLNRVERDTPY